MGLKKKLQESMYQYVYNVLLPACYAVSSSPYSSFEEYSAAVLEQLKAERKEKE